MAKKIEKKTDRDRVNELAQRLANEMFFAGYIMKVAFSDTEDDDDGEGTTTYASCSADWPYRAFTITIYPAFFAEPEEMWPPILRHELIHVILHPVTDLLSAARSGLLVTHKQQRDAIEGTVDWLAALFP